MSHNHGLAWWGAVIVSSTSFRLQHTPAILIEITHLRADAAMCGSYQQNLFANLGGNRIPTAEPIHIIEMV
jgi:hypothetical protein